MRIFEPKRGANGDWRRLRNEELLYRSSNIVRAIKSRRLRWAAHVSRMEEGGSAFKILTGTPTGKRPLGRPIRRWENNNRMDLKETGVDRESWVDSAQEKGLLESLCECGIEPPGFISHGVSILQRCNKEGPPLCRSGLRFDPG